MISLAVAVSWIAHAGAVLQSPYSADYTLTQFSSISGVPANFGGVTFLNSNTILLGGAANGASGAIYSVPVLRDASNQITGFGSATLYASAPYIDGGLAFGTDGNLYFTEYPENELGEITEPCTPPCSPNEQTVLTGIASSVGTIGFVPGGFQGAGNAIIGSYSGGEWYNVTLSGGVPASPTLLENTGGGPEGIVWILAGSPDFPANTALVSQYGTGTVVAYQVDSNGAPTGSGQSFITGLTGAEGATIDPLTGDFLFSTFGGGSSLDVVAGFNAPSPEPASFSLIGLGLIGLAWRARRGRK
jgi:hypothetical protein